MHWSKLSYLPNNNNHETPEIDDITAYHAHIKTGQVFSIEHKRYSPCS